MYQVYRRLKPFASKSFISSSLVHLAKNQGVPGVLGVNTEKGKYSTFSKLLYRVDIWVCETDSKFSCRLTVIDIIYCQKNNFVNQIQKVRFWDGDTGDSGDSS